MATNTAEIDVTLEPNQKQHTAYQLRQIAHAENLESYPTLNQPRPKKAVHKAPNP